VRWHQYQLNLNLINTWRRHIPQLSNPADSGTGEVPVVLVQNDKVRDILNTEIRNMEQNSSIDH